MAFMYAYLVIFAFSKCFLPLAERDYVQTIILYNMCMRIEAKMSYDYLMRRPTGARLIVCSPMGKCCRPIVGLSSADRKALQLIKVIGEVCFNVVAPVGRRNCFYRPIKMQNSCRPTIDQLSVLL